MKLARTNVPNGLIERFDKELRKSKPATKKRPGQQRAGSGGHREREREKHIGAPSLMGGQGVI